MVTHKCIKRKGVSYIETKIDLSRGVTDKALMVFDLIDMRTISYCQGKSNDDKLNFKRLSKEVWGSCLELVTEWNYRALRFRGTIKGSDGEYIEVIVDDWRKTLSIVVERRILEDSKYNLYFSQLVNGCFK